ncbi:MAG: phosphoenolpyruvate synthase, partial [Candidatus Thiodiazotropha sp. (ex Lucinoma kastoroae)]|nr:phosphoenolpyruvate synthase [Candidatus Thiodiazotropha sp. (ex Lucinoma kastoroae)]
VDQVGGKNASLGEMISGLANAGVSVPGGFATTAHAFREFLRHNHLAERIDPLLKQLDVEDVTALAEAGKTVREWVIEAPFPEELENAVTAAYKKLTGNATQPPSVAVRSSATAEDLPDASFAGQQETFLNVQGLDDVMIAIKEVFASLYNDRAISYRVHQGFAHEEVALSAGIQRMVRSDIGSAGVMFTLDTESGFKDAVFITSSYGLGETVVQGSVNPDEFYVHKGNVKAGRPAILRRNLGSKAIKMVYGQAGEARVVTVDVPEQERRQFSLTGEQIESLAQMAITIEKHYQRPMDIEWGLDGSDGQLYILQARPETVESRVDATSVERFKLEESGNVLTQGRAIGQRIGSGVAKIIHNASEMSKVAAGDVLITDMTDPDWEPVMKRASAIVTNRGGRTCHAAIIARELGIPAVVGCHDATETLIEGQEVTVSCAEGDDGFIYEGLLKFSITHGDVTSLPEPPVKIMMNVANPSRAFAFSRIPNAGIGLARLEFIINTTIGVHPRALMEFDKLPPEIKSTVQKQIDGYEDPVSFYVDKLVEGISTLAAAFNGKSVIVRISDF